MSKLLRTETVFHTLSVAVILHAVIYRGEVSEGTLAAAAAIAALGRVTPTEIVDERLNIPLGSAQNHESSD